MVRINLICRCGFLDIERNLIATVRLNRVLCIVCLSQTHKLHLNFELDYDLLTTPIVNVIIIPSRE